MRLFIPKNKLNSLVIFMSLTFLCSTMSAQSFAEKVIKLEAQRTALESDLALILKDLETAKLGKVHEDLEAVGLPKGAEGQIVSHAGMKLCYNEEHEQAAWVAHIVTADVIKGNLKRTNDFREDPDVKTGTCVKEDYWDSGFDRGHLAPSADFRWSKTAISESYFYSNMSPQRPEFNRERWADLERWVRAAVFSEKEQMIVITGPILKKGLKQITQGPNKLSIPESFFKVILDLEGDEKKAIAFLMPNGTCNRPVISYSMSIDKLEQITGYNFFPELEDDLENQLEAMNDVKKWEKSGSGNLADVPPMTNDELPKDCISTADAPFFLNQKATVCGTVVSTKKTKSGSVFLNLDTKFPNQIFSITIWGSDINNFSYSPEIELKGKKICVNGLIKDYKGTPTVNVKNEKKIELMDAKK